MNSGGIGNGSASIILVFAVLCMTIFALISLSTSTADSQLTDRSMSMVLGYYEADKRAELIIAELLYKGGISEDSVIQGVAVSVTKLDEGYSAYYGTHYGYGAQVVSFYVPVTHDYAGGARGTAFEREGHRNVLFVRVRIEGNVHSVLEWRLYNVQEWIPFNEIMIHGGAQILW